MNHITAVQPGVWRWDGVDPDHGFPIVGYLVKLAEGVALIDPPESASAEAIRACGEPFAIILTSKWHVRGTPKWAQAFGIPVVAPTSARMELREAGIYADLDLLGGEVQYGWEVIRLTAPEVKGYVYDELAFWHRSSGVLVVGDLLTADNKGNVGLGPHQFAEVPLADLKAPLDRLARLQPRLLLSSHLGPREDGAELLARLRGQVEAEA